MPVITQVAGWRAPRRQQRCIPPGLTQDKQFTVFGRAHEIPIVVGDNGQDCREFTDVKKEYDDFVTICAIGSIDKQVKFSRHYHSAT